MKVVILCGGFGTRLREETEFRPKPMVPVGNRPILWHIMKIYAHYGHKDFILCLGYKGDVIKDYFRNYKWNTSDVQLNLGPAPKVKYLTNHNEEDWQVSMVDTGPDSMTGGRIRRVLKYIDSDSFLATYGDGVTNSDINASIEFHKKHGKLATLTAVQPAARFGDVVVEGTRVSTFKEKTKDFSHYVNGGFFVFNKSIGDYLKDDSTVLEHEPLARLAEEGQVQAFRHSGFWQCMDTYREQQILDKMYTTGQAPWKIW